jgi:hypothetical protein
VSKTRQAMIDEILTLHPPSKHSIQAVRHTYDRCEDSALNSLLERLQDAVAVGAKISSETAPGHEAVREEMAAIRSHRRGLIERLEQVDVSGGSRQEALSVESEHARQSVVSKSPRRIAKWEPLWVILDKAARSVSTDSFVFHTAPGAGKSFAIAEVLKHVNEFTLPAKIFNDQIASLWVSNPSAIDEVAKEFSVDLHNTISKHVAANAFTPLISSGAFSRRKQLAIRLLIARELVASSKHFPFISPELRAEVLPHPHSINSPSEIIKTFSKLAIAAQAAQAVVIGYHDGISRALAEFLAQSAGCARSSAVDFKNKDDWNRVARTANATGQDNPVVLVASYFSQSEKYIEKLLTDTAAAIKNADVRVLSLATGEEPRSFRDVHYSALLTEAKIEELWGRDAQCATDDESFSFVGANGHATLNISAGDLLRETRTRLEIEADYQKHLAGVA